MLISTEQKMNENLSTQSSVPPPSGDGENSLWKKFASLGTIVGALAGAYAFGHSNGSDQREIVMGAKYNELQVRAEKAEAKLAIAEEKRGLLNDEYVKLGQINVQLREAIVSRNGQVDDLSSQVRSANNCAFIQTQIKSLERDINTPSFSMSSNTREEYETKERLRHEELERRIGGYLTQLGNGACK